MGRLFRIMAVLAVALALLIPTQPVLSCIGTRITATVTATAKWTAECAWTIDKSVTPDTWDLFEGDTGTSLYTITVTKSCSGEQAWVEGQVCVKNCGAVATQNLAITIQLRNANNLIATAPVDVSSHPVITPGETWCYPYKVNIPAASIQANGLYKVTAKVTITNGLGVSPFACTNLPSKPTSSNDTINVDDTNGGSWTFSNSGSVTYEKTFTCEDEGVNTNTATIRETGQSDDASVIVNCYGLEVVKTAQTSFTRRYYWTIDKSADQSALTLSICNKKQVNYQVCVDATYVDIAWAVVGTITVLNPAPMVADIIGIADEVSPDIAAVADFGPITYPYALAAEGGLAGTYSADLPDASSRTNTTTVTIQNYAYKWDGTATPIGTTTFSGTTNIDFSTAEMEEIDECITVTDTYAGSVGTVCYSAAPKCFKYSRWIGPYKKCGCYKVDNTASFVTNDTKTTGSDSWRVTVTVKVSCHGCNCK